MTDYQFPQFQRLEPRTQFKGGRITETDVLTLAEAAKFASVHAGTEITPADFLRSAKRGEVVLRAIVHQTAKLQRIGGGVYCNAGQPTENTVPSGSILTLPISACWHLEAAGRASWRTFDGFEMIDGILKRYTIAELMPEEPDFETTTDDCRVMGNAVHAVADAYIGEPAPASAATSATAKPVTDSEWKALARTQALEFIKHQRERDLFPSQEAIGYKIAADFRKAGIVGADGKPLTGSTIKRHALKGISSAIGKQLSTSIVRGK